MKYVWANIKTYVKNLYFKWGAHRFIVFHFSSRSRYLALQSAWIRQHKHTATLNDFYQHTYQVSRMYDLFHHVASTLNNHPFYYLEFGVFKGDSIRWWVQHISAPQAKFFGFDSFEGLPEDFGMIKKGGYHAGGKTPDMLDPRCHFIQGWFKDTLPAFVQQQVLTDLPKVIHIDCDLYSSTSLVLTALAPHLREGDIIIFDEFITPTQEFRAFYEFYTQTGWECELIGAVNNYHQSAIRLISKASYK